MTTKRMRVLVYTHDAKYGALREIDGSLESMRHLIGGGYIEPVYLDRQLVAIVDEEGLLKGLPRNTCSGAYGLWVGTFFVARVTEDDDGADFTSLTEQDILTVRMRFDRQVAPFEN